MALQLGIAERALCAEGHSPQPLSDLASARLSSGSPLVPAGLFPIAGLAGLGLGSAGPKSGGFAASAIKVDKVPSSGRSGADLGPICRSLVARRFCPSKKLSISRTFALGGRVPIPFAPRRVL
jgi:hypothetical protein